MRFVHRKLSSIVVSGFFAVSVDAAPVEGERSRRLDLYVDVTTKQIFAEPGPNRIHLGVFKREDGEPNADSTSVDGKPADAAVTPAAVEPLPDPLRDPNPEMTATERRLQAQQRRLEERLDKLASTPPTAPSAAKKWYDNVSVRGYIQLRDNFTLDGDRDDVRAWNDASVGEDRNFFIRRARLIISSAVGERLFVYLQPDFASSAGDTGNVAQLRDAYGDVYLDKDKREYRVRVGQSKIPFSFENLQSSQNRLSLDRNDALNSCCRDERDLGAFFYYTPAGTRTVFSDLVRNGLKGSGDYGVFAFGVYNGQGANRTERNEGLHTVARFTYPYRFANGQIFESGVQALTGRFVPSTDGNLPGLPANRYNNSDGFLDQRVGIHAVLYPQPFGLQAEWNWGRGPALNDARTDIETQSLNGGYVQAMYRIENAGGTGVWMPFVKWQYFDGAMKFQANAPQTQVRDWEFGLEWQPDAAIRLSMVYQRYRRNDVTRAPYAFFEADVLRMQMQLSF
ncbi:MAG: hypothetical protein KIT73_09145 [Burkholderiales bacterium]|nr:hypothetical protein [Burkholderiales bacterium]